MRQLIITFQDNTTERLTIREEDADAVATTIRKLGGRVEVVVGSYIAIIPNYWGRSDDPKEALLKAMRTAGLHGKREQGKVPHAIYWVEDKEAYCSELDGSIIHRRGTKVELLEKFEPSVRRVK